MAQQTFHAGFRAALVALGFGSVFSISASAQTVWFVDDDAPPNGDGLAWASAFDDLQIAIELAMPGDSIWLAEGTYTPSVIDPIAGVERPYFLMPDGVAILGGFDGTETDESQRDPAANETIISGDLLGNDITDVVIDMAAADDPDRLGPVLESKLDNADLLFFVDRTGPGTRLDGLTMTGVLKRNVSGFGPASRGTVFAIGAEFEIADCLITGNVGGATTGVVLIDCGIVDFSSTAGFEDHPCQTGAATPTSSRVLIERTSLVDNPPGFVPVPPGAAAGSVWVGESDLTFRDSHIEMTVPFATPLGGLDLCGSAGIAGGGNLGRDVEIIRSSFVNTGNSGAINFGVDFRWDNNPFRSVNVLIEDSTFHSISSGLRPTIASIGGDFIMSRCLVVNNESEDSTGLLEVLGGQSASAHISDSAFVGNRAFLVTRGFPDDGLVTGCTFAANVQRNGIDPQPAFAISLRDTNTAHGLIIDATPSLSEQVTNSIVPGFADASRNIIGLDPLFVRPPDDGGDGWGDDPATPDVDESINDDFGDLRLRPNSPAIDRADASLVDPGALDLDGNPRVVDDIGASNAPGFTLDYGAFEFQGTSCPADVNGDGLADTADFFAWTEAFNTDGPGCDVNRDGECSSPDFFAWVRAFGVGCE